MFLQRYSQETLDCSTIKHPWNATDNTLKLTRIPPRVSMTAEFEELKHKFHQLREDIKSNLKEHFDARGVSGNEFHANKIMDALAQTQKKVDTIANLNQTMNDSDISVNEIFLLLMQRNYL